MFYFDTFRIILNPSSVKKETNTWQKNVFITVLFEYELMMPTSYVKYILCKILVSDSLLRKDFFP